jgi:protein-disulfide isomerase-like protein with CxxC motif
MPLTFAVTWDYRCPFARNAHEHVVAGLEGGADWEVTFVPFSLGQVHVKEGDTDVWDDPAKDSGLLALQAGTVVRDRFPDQFLAVHRALFAARHDEGLHIEDEAVVGDVLAANGVDSKAVLHEIASGSALETVRKEHEASVASHDVWGVPTFIAGENASFVRLMSRPEGDTELGRHTIERVATLLTGFPELNEFKHTTLKR